MQDITYENFVSTLFFKYRSFEFVAKMEGKVKKIEEELIIKMINLKNKLI